MPCSPRHSPQLPGQWKPQWWPGHVGHSQHLTSLLSPRAGASNSLLSGGMPS